MMAEPPDIECVHLDKERLERGWQCMQEKQSSLNMQDQQFLQEAMETMCQLETATSTASSGSSAPFTSAMSSSDAACWPAAVPCGGAATFSTASAVAASVPGRSSAAANRLALLRANRHRPRCMKAINRSTSWLKGWLGRYGLAVVLAIYAMFDRADLLRSFSCQRSCFSASLQAEDDAIGVNSALTDSMLQGLPDLAQFRMLQAGIITGVHAPGNSHPDVKIPVPNRDDSHRGRLRPSAGLLALDRRMASSGSSSGSSSTSSSSAGGHASHPHEAMFFLILALITGTFVTHMLSLPLFKGLQQTVVLFVAGVVLALVLEGFKLTPKTAVFGRSFDMWMDIDPHLLLFTLLPPLVTGDAMGIDTTVAKRVAKQCLFLAGPGVALAGFACATFLKFYLPYDWPFLLCLTTGSILCATDPVAVVALLKELGASPTLTVQIQGESLLNDGTAIVLYTIAYNMLSGQEYDVGDIIMFLVKMAIYAWGLGMVIGFVFYKWIKLANNKLNHNSAVIQVALTICCAYASFIIAEGGFHISGVLSTVAAAGVLAHKMWPEVVSRESMETVWHMLEYLGNSLIFFLAGALSGKVMVRIDPIDYLHLCSIYVCLFIIRGSIFFGFRPLFKFLHSERHPVTKQEATVMTWGGLRGAIGLALAIQVNVGRADNRVNQEDADRVLFYVSGIAALTLIINASTCPAIVRKLGVTSMPATKRIMLSILNRQLLELSRAKTKPGRVRNALKEVLDEIEEHIQAPQRKLAMAKDQWKNGIKMLKQGKAINVLLAENVTESKAVGAFCKPHPFLQSRGTSVGDTADIFARIADHTKKVKQTAERRSRKTFKNSAEKVIMDPEDTDYEDKDGLISNFLVVRQKYESLPKVKIAPKLVGLNVQELPLQDAQDDMIALVKSVEPDLKILKAVNQAFLGIVRSQYWHMIEHGDFFDNEAEQVLGSVTEALSAQSADLNDFSFIEPFIHSNFAQSNGRMSVAFKAARSAREKSQDSCLHKFIEAPIFSGAISLVIVATSVLTVVEQEIGEEAGEKKDLFWVVCEVFFMAVFLLEFLLKFCDLKCGYFMEASNCFDFLLVIIGGVGCVFTLMLFLEPESPTGTGSNIPASQTRLVRVVQIFRMMRIFRLFRLYVMVTVLKVKCCRRNTKSSFDVAEHMQKTTILLNFSRAHMASQEKIVKFFGRRLGSMVDMTEVARCILQSHISVYKALTLAEIETRLLEPSVLTECSIAEENRAVAEDCEHFIAAAGKDGILTQHETEEFLHTIHSHIAKFLHVIHDSHVGQYELTEGGYAALTPPASSSTLKDRKNSDKTASSAETVPLRAEEPDRGGDAPENSPQAAQPRSGEENDQAVTEETASSKAAEPSTDNSTIDSKSSSRDPPPQTMGRRTIEMEKGDDKAEENPAISRVKSGRFKKGKSAVDGEDKKGKKLEAINGVSKEGKDSRTSERPQEIAASPPTPSQKARFERNDTKDADTKPPKKTFKKAA